MLDLTRARRTAAQMTVMIGLGGAAACSGTGTKTFATRDGGGGGGGANGDNGGAPQTPGVNASNESLQVGAATRTYVLVVPSAYDAKKSYPLVLSFHGEPSTGADMRQIAPFEAVSQADAIVAYPDGADRHWDLYGTADRNADFAFVRALVDDLARKYNVDKSRVLGTGYSNGAFFVNELACHVPGLFRAIAPHAGGAPDESNDPSATKDAQGFWRCPGAPVAAIVFHGTADDVVPSAGGDFEARFWAHAAGCNEERSPTTPEPCVKNAGCPAGKPVEWCFIPGLGHVVWKDGNAAAWAFFSAL